MNPNRIQLGVDIGRLAGNGELSRQEVAGIVRIALAALDNGADYLKVPAEGSALLVNSLLSLAAPSLMLEGSLAAAERLVAGPQQPALFELTDVNELGAATGLCEAAMAADMELVLSVTAPWKLPSERLPEGIVGLSLDARPWATSSGAERARHQQLIETAIADADDNELFVHLAHLPAVADGEEAATLGGVAGIEMGTGLLPLLVDGGLAAGLAGLKRMLVDAQQGALAIALEEHDHHHDHSHDHDAGCGCHH